MESSKPEYIYSEGGGGNWRDGAACLGTDPELFFPIGTTGFAVEQIERAKAVCAKCDVVHQCLRYALDTDQETGVWGNTSEDERRALKRRANQSKRAGRQALQKEVNYP